MTLTLRGHVENGRIVVDERVDLPEGAEVTLSLVSARQQAKKIADWWETNREKAPTLLAEELEAAFARVPAAPTTVRVYRERKGHVIRRLLLPRTCHHVLCAAALIGAIDSARD